MLKRFYFLLFAFVFCGQALAKDSPRYISLAPATTEILFALGLNDEIVGVSTYCNFPKEAETKEKIGEFSSPNIEKIFSLRPDYVFCTGLEQMQVVAALKRLNLKVYVSDPKNMRELFDSITAIGKITKKNQAAQDLVQSMQDEIDAITSKTKLIPGEKKPKVFLELWDEPLTTAGTGSFIDELVTLAGGKNIAWDTLRPYSIFSAEEVIARNPDCIILTYMVGEKSLESVSRRFAWGSINAVKYSRLYNDIDPNLILRPGPRLTKGLKELYQRFYP